MDEGQGRRTRQGSGEQDDLPTAPARVRERLDGAAIDLRPANRAGRALAAIHERGSAEAIGIVEVQDRGLSARAERAAVHRMRLVSFELDRATFARLHEKSASGR